MSSDLENKDDVFEYLLTKYYESMDSCEESVMFKEGDLLREIEAIRRRYNEAL